MLDDPMWQTTEFVELGSGTVRAESLQGSCMVGLNYDGKLLYVGIRAGKRRGKGKPSNELREPDSGERARRDADLVGHDRVVISIDTNRDYWSSFRLVLDHRGWSRESCVGFPAWDPEWYIVTKQDETQWTAEAAIPLAELQHRVPKRGDAWNLGLMRVIPGHSSQLWPPSANDSTGTASYGLLLFE